MRRTTSPILTGLVLLAAGFVASGFQSGIVAGLILADSDLARIRGLNPQTKSDQISPVGCEAFNLGPNETRPDLCRKEILPPPNQNCVACSDLIATFVSTGPNNPGNPQVDDGNYQCVGQKSTAPCRIPLAGPPASCGTFMPVNGVFCNANPTDWDAE